MVANQNTVGLVLVVYGMECLLKCIVLRIPGNHNPVGFVQIEIQCLKKIGNGRTCFFHPVGEKQ